MTSQNRHTRVSERCEGSISLVSEWCSLFINHITYSPLYRDVQEKCFRFPYLFDLESDERWMSMLNANAENVKFFAIKIDESTINYIMACACDDPVVHDVLRRNFIDFFFHSAPLVSQFNCQSTTRHDDCIILLLLFSLTTFGRCHLSTRAATVILSQFLSILCATAALSADNNGNWDKMC